MALLDWLDLPSMDRLGLERQTEIAVTGLRRAGKTVLITSLIHNLLRSPRRPEVLPLLGAAQTGRLNSAVLTPAEEIRAGGFAPFPYEETLRHLLADQPDWPETTDQVTRLEVTLRFIRRSWMGMVPGLDRGVLRMGLTDYPGEWLVDLPMLQQDYAGWSRSALARMATPPRDKAAEPYLQGIARLKPDAPTDEATVQTLVRAWRALLQECRDRLDLAFLQPGRYLEPGPTGFETLPAFAPLDLKGKGVVGGSLGGLMAQRFDQYRDQVVKPFFIETFQRCRRHVVLVDLIGALHGGQAVYEDRRDAIDAVLSAFQDRRIRALGRWFPSGQERVLFAATKADQLPPKRRRELQALFDWAIDRSANTARSGGATEQTMVLSALRCTVDETVQWKGGLHDVVVGTAPGERTVQISHKPIPDKHPPPEYWADLPKFPPLLPPAQADLSGPGLPHINLDAALQFLIGDLLE